MTLLGAAKALLDAQGKSSLERHDAIAALRDAVVRVELNEAETLTVMREVERNAGSVRVAVWHGAQENRRHKCGEIVFSTDAWDELVAANEVTVEVRGR